MRKGAASSQGSDAAGASSPSSESALSRGAKQPSREILADWNVVVSTREQGYKAVRAALREFGEIRRTEYFNVLVMKVGDIATFLEDLRSLVDINPAMLEGIGRIAPAADTFDFATATEFETKLREVALDRISDLAGKSFHCRIHGRGLRPLLSSRTAEQNLNRALLEALAARGTPGSLAFTDPDAVLAVETVGRRAGVSLWTRDELAKYPFLRID